MSNKEKCEKCKRILRTNKLSKNKVTKQMLCLRCNNKIGQNKFYSPYLKIRRNNLINNFNITDLEKQVLSSRGKNTTRISKLCSGLKNMRKEKRTKEKLDKLNKKIESGKQIETQKKFLEGLTPS